VCYTAIVHRGSVGLPVRSRPVELLKTVVDAVFSVVKRCGYINNSGVLNKEYMHQEM
jgi:hypothetical protein